MPPIASVARAAAAAASYEMKEQDFLFLQKLPGNKFCVDCGAPNPDWGSPKLGILFCFRCSGIHRGLGTHISFVRSVTMDAWKDKEICLMKAGGNAQCLEFLRTHGLVETKNNSDDDDRTTTTTTNLDLPLRTVPAKKKYDSPAAELYRQVLLARIEGRSEPTELAVAVVLPRTNSSLSSSKHGASTAATTTTTTSNGGRTAVDKSRIQGFGSNGSNSGVGSNGCGLFPPSAKRRKIVQKCLWVTVTVVTLGGALWFAKSSSSSS